MASEKDFCDILKKVKILLLDIEGTTTSISFVKDKLFIYAEENVKQFLDSQWENTDVKDAVTALRTLAIADQEGKVDGVVAIPGEDASKEEQIDGLVKSVKWQMSADRKAGALKQLQGLIWKQGYENGDIKGHVYDDVSAALEAWHSAEGQKVYIYSSGSVQAQKLLFGQSLAGDLLQYIDGHFDTTVGAKQEAQSYKNIVEKIGCQADEILFLTDIVKEAEAAREAGVHAALVVREGNAPLSEEAISSFPVLRSLSELTISNKRKPEPQEETPAAKVPKTGAEDDVKVTSATPALETTAEPQPEKMDVDDAVTDESQQAPVKEQVVVEEITDSNEASSVVSAVDLDPVVLEDESCEEKKTTAAPPQIDVKQTPVEEKKEVDEPVAEELPPAPAVVTEVEELVEDRPLPEVDEMATDVQPIVEEPDNTEEMEELKNVGDNLEKECDEILSKVNSVTNMDTIAIKPLLDPVPEETMETENTDSNDIVNRILDTEIDLEMKQCEDIDLNTVSEMGEEKTEIAENGLKEASPVEAVTENGDKAKGTIPEVTDSPMEAEAKGEAQETVVPKEVVEPEVEKIEDAPAAEAESTTNVKINDPVAEIASQETSENNTSEEVMPETRTIEPETVKADAKETVPIIEESKLETVPVVEESKPEETVPKESSEEPQVNGKATNGDSKNVMNGDANNTEELNDRLSVDEAVEKTEVNGSNGNGVEEKGQGDCKMEEIKVKTVAEEPRTDPAPTDQPTEA